MTLKIVEEMTIEDFEDRRCYDLLKWFQSDHLPNYLQPVTLACRHTAFLMAAYLPDSAELTAGLRKLLEAKDCFVRGKVEVGDADETIL